jgi:hypothetical protein
MNTGPCCSDTDRRKLEYSEKNPFQCNFFHHKSRVSLVTGWRIRMFYMKITDTVQFLQVQSANEDLTMFCKYSNEVRSFILHLLV